MSSQLKLRLFGYFSSLLLTGVAFWIIAYPKTFHLGINTAVIIILFLAVLQFIVQSVSFIHIWKEDGPPWNLAIFLTTVSMAITIVAFSIWIIYHLNYNMMYT